MTPAEVARLTDWQIEHLYVGPAVERARRMERDRKGLPEEPTPTQRATAPKPGSRQHRAMWESGFVAMGMKPEAAREKYDRQLKRFLTKKTGA